MAVLLILHQEHAEYSSRMAGPVRSPAPRAFSSYHTSGLARNVSRSSVTASMSRTRTGTATAANARLVPACSTSSVT
jgi:hypothetical protein